MARASTIVIAFLIALCLIFNSNFNFWSAIFNEQYQLFFLLTGALILIFTSKSINISLPDLSVISLLLYLYLSRSVRVPSLLDMENLTLLPLIVLYIGLKSVDWHSASVMRYYMSLIIIGTGLSIYGILEYLRVVENEETMWPVTGNFYNPGLYGCFLSLFVPVAMSTSWKSASKKELCATQASNSSSPPNWLSALLGKMQSSSAWMRHALAPLKPGNYKHTKWLYVLVLLLLFTSIIISESRTGLVSAIICLLLAIWKKKGKKYFITVVCLAFFGMILVILGSNKGFDSLQGRFLIWKISFLIFKANWFAGIGHHSFASLFMDYQGQYFQSGIATPAEVWLAGNTEHTFNEIIKFIVENGILGVSLILRIIFINIKFSHPPRTNNFVFQSSILIFLSFRIISFFISFRFPRF